MPVVKHLQRLVDANGGMRQPGLSVAAVHYVVGDFAQLHMSTQAIRWGQRLVTARLC
jgi:hypothetical protein